MMMQNASLDTSFWNFASQLGVVPYLFDFFQVYYCQVVRWEIITTDPAKTSLIYPQAKLFEMVETDGRLHRKEPQHPLTRFGAGEAHAIALALEENWVLLINDWRPLEFARVLGIRCISVPGFCVLLYDQGKITFPAIQGYLKRLGTSTHATLITQAEQVAIRLARQRGDLL